MYIKTLSIKRIDKCNKMYRRELKRKKYIYETLIIIIGKQYNKKNERKKEKSRK